MSSFIEDRCVKRVTSGLALGAAVGGAVGARARPCSGHARAGQQ